MTVTLKLRQLFQVNVAVAGNMGSGKSTLIGVLSTGQYDNGKGSARTQVISMFINDDDNDCTCITIYDMMMLVELLDTLFCVFLPFHPQHSSSLF
jgi:ABC-type transport system involved in cytochrome bd biosynthesis fused ATPase/permease subunit